MHTLDALEIGIIGKQRDVRLDIALARCIVRSREELEDLKPILSRERFVVHA
jgi:hypothetical protein